jgi:DNA-binding MarR family transcriptional regulator
VRALRLLLCLGLLLPGTAAADEIELPTSDAAQLAATEILKQLPNFRPDRLLASDVPGPVVNDEVVHVGIAGDGSVRRVLLDQRLELKGTGDYAVRERGPAREARSLTEDPAPITRKGGVVWQGFSPGSRDLAARLLLDRTALSRNLDPLVAQGWIEIARGTDARTREARVTNRGLAALESATPHWERAQKQVAARLGRDKLDVLIDVLSELESLHPSRRSSPQPSPRATGRARTRPSPTRRSGATGHPSTNPKQR